MFRVLVWGVCVIWIPVSVHANSCGVLENTDRLDDLNTIIACLERKIESVQGQRESIIPLESRITIDADSATEEGGLQFIGQGCQHEKKYLYCRVFIKNITDKSIEVEFSRDGSSVVGVDGDSYRPYFITYNGTRDTRFRTEIIPGQGGNALYEMREIPENFRSAAFRTSLKNTANEKVFRVFVRSPFVEDN